MKKICKKNQNIYLKNGGKCTDISELGDDGELVINDLELKDKIYFVIINTIDGYVKSTKGVIQNQTIISELNPSLDNVRVFCTNMEHFRNGYKNRLDVGQITRGKTPLSFGRKHPEGNDIQCVAILTTNRKFVELVSKFAPMRGYLDVESLGNFRDLKKYYLIVKIKNPAFANEFPNNEFLNYYHILEASNTLPVKYYDKCETEYNTLHEKYNTLQEKDNTYSERYYNILQEQYDTLQGKYNTLQEKDNTYSERYYNILQEQYDILQGKYNTLQKDGDNVSEQITMAYSDSCDMADMLRSMSTRIDSDGMVTLKKINDALNKKLDALHTMTSEITIIR